MGSGEKTAKSTEDKLTNRKPFKEARDSYLRLALGDKPPAERV